jgi:hypothetical protein
MAFAVPLALAPGAAGPVVNYKYLLSMYPLTDNARQEEFAAVVMLFGNERRERCIQRKGYLNEHVHRRRTKTPL